MSNRKIQTVERTTKRAKLFMLLSGIWIIVSFVAILSGSDGNQKYIEFWGMNCFFALLLYFGAKLWAWWQTG